MPGHNTPAYFSFIQLSQRLHGGEQQNVADAVGIGEQHYEAVEAEAQAARDGPCGSIGYDSPVFSGVFASLLTCFAFAGVPFSSLLAIKHRN